MAFSLVPYQGEHYFLNDLVKRIESDSGDKAVEIFIRSDGTYGFEAFKYVQPEMAWIPVGPGTVCIVDSAEAAETEARERLAWMT